MRGALPFRPLASRESNCLSRSLAEMWNTMEFTVTQSDVDAFLASCLSNETVGYRYEPDSCLLANALTKKYPMYWWKVELDSVRGLLDLDEVTIEDHGLPIDVYFLLSPEMTAVVKQFDLLKCPFERITKEQWLAAQAVAV